MTSIRSLSEILLEDRDIAEADRRRFAGIISAESVRLTGLLDEILDLSRLEAGAAAMQLTETDVRSVAEAAVETLTPIADRRGVRIRLASQPGAGAAHSDPDRLLQVLINLLSNAIKYNRDDRPTVDILHAEAGGIVTIDVTDNGGGVPRAEALGIFEKFTRGRNADVAQGAGLGLPISRAIMRAMEGDLDLVFRADGSSFFRLTVPAYRARPL